MITKITCRYSFEVLDFNCNNFGFTFNIGVSYLSIFIRHQWVGTSEALKSFITPSIKKNRDVIVIHTGCNNIVNNIDTIKKFQSILDIIIR